MKRLLSRILAVALLASVAACGKTASVDDFRKGLPDDGSVKITTPQKNDAVIGQTAEWYSITFGVTTAVNVTVLAILDLLHDIVKLTPTSHPSADVYVWGPGSGSPLDPLVYRLTVTDNEDGTFSYDFDAKGKNDADTAFVTFLSGKHTPVDDTHGSGTFTLDWDKRNTLANPQNDDKGRALQGTWVVTYDHKNADASVDVNFSAVYNDQNVLTPVTYHFTQASGADGKFQYSTSADVNGNGTQELVTVESRWKQDGSGRADIHVTGGDVPAGDAPGTASQCWDANFISQFEVYAVPTGATSTFSQTNGDASACSFSAAEYYAN